jgi:hypothetical protein
MSRSIDDSVLRLDRSMQMPRGSRRLHTSRVAAHPRMARLVS